MISTEESVRAAAALEEAEGLRLRFAEEVGYGRVAREDAHRLALLVMRELAAHAEAGGMRMRLAACEYERAEGGGMRRASVRVDGPYFEDREAVSFDADGHVGVAGWADSGNMRPFLRALSAWIDGMAGGRPGGGAA